MLILTLFGEKEIIKIIYQINFEIEVRRIPERYKNKLMWALILGRKVNQIKRYVCCLRVEKGVWV
jgi:hypothetical protein